MKQDIKNNFGEREREREKKREREVYTERKRFK